VKADRSARLGFDVGGQSIKAVLMDDTGRVLAEAKGPTGLDIEADGLIRELARLAAELAAAAPSSATIADTIGIGIAGVMAGDGVLAGSPNLPRLVGLGVRDALARGLARPVAVDNDANCAALAEGWHGGAAADCRDFLLVTLGSGIGSGLVIGGALHHGATGYACELGHSVVVAGGRLCGCGNRGCLEAYASESAARSLVAEAGGALERAVERLVGEQGMGHAHALDALATGGDEGARKIVDGMIDMLGTGFASAVNILDVPTFVLGGGIAPAVFAREAALRAAMQRSLFARSERSVKILAARRGTDAGAVGAARLAMLAGD
jgi:glucokinase